MNYLNINWRQLPDPFCSRSKEFVIFFDFDFIMLPLSIDVLYKIPKLIFLKELFCKSK